MRPLLSDPSAPPRRAGSSGIDERYRCPWPARGRPLNQSLYLWAKTVFPNYILTMLGDRMEMAHSIEGRVPFLDHHSSRSSDRSRYPRNRGM